MFIHKAQGSGGSALQSKILKSCRGCFTVPVLATPILVARIGFWPFFFSSQLGLILFQLVCSSFLFNSGSYEYGLPPWF